MNKKAFFFFLATCLTTALFELSTVDAQTTQPVLDASQLYLTKKHEARFIFYFNAGDRVEIWTNIVSGASSKGDLDDVTVRVIRLETEIPVAGFLASARGDERTIDIVDDGRYTIRYSSGQPVVLSTKVFRKPPPTLKKGETHEILQVRSLWVGDVSQPEQPRFTFTAHKNDALYISSTSSPFDILKYRIVQTGDLEWVKAGTPFQVPADGVYTVQFLIEGESERILIFDKTQKGAVFDDILIGRFVHDPDASDEVQAPGMSENAGPDPSIEIMKSIHESQTSNQQAIMDRQQESEQAMAEMMQELVTQLTRKDTVMTNAYPGTITLPVEGVPPKFDLRASNRRQCHQITELQVREPVLWAFYVAVGQSAYNEYMEREQRTRQYQGKTPLFSYAESQRNNARSSLLPTDQENMPEAIEMAIVDEANKERFEKGESYVEFGTSKPTSGELSQYMYGVRPPPEGDLFFCVCNHNRTSPIDMWLLYETFRFEEEQ